VLYQESDTSIEIEVESSADFSRLEYVFVIDTRSGETAAAPVSPTEQQPDQQPLSEEL
jgi:hypothetical protein